MMGVGRKAVPTKLKIVKGTDQPCRINKNEPQPKSNNIRMPQGLSESAKKHWKHIVKELKESGIITNIDVPALSLYCESYSMWKDATENINKYGAVVKSEHGYPVRSPYLLVAQRGFDQMKAMLTEFGMTPSSRTKVSITEEKKKKDDPWSDL